MLLAAPDYLLEKKRLPSRRPRMTFIVGMKCKNGLVLAADSLEVDGYTRRTVNKLEIFHKDDWGMCWGLAGSARVADKFSDKLKQSLDDVTQYDRGKIESVVEACLRVAGKRYPTPVGIEIVVGLFGPHSKTGKLDWHLLRAHSSDACLSLQKDACCAGTGDNTLANFIFENSKVRFLRTFQAQHLAVFVVSLMKEYADGVGGPIKIWTFVDRKPQWLPLASSEMRQFEKDFSVEDFELALMNHLESKEQKYYRQWMDEENKEAIERLEIKNKKAVGGNDKATTSG